MAPFRFPDLNRLSELTGLYGRLQLDYGAPGARAILASVEKSMEKAVRDLQRLKPEGKLRGKEPDDLSAIRALRPASRWRRIWPEFSADSYRDRIEGALAGRMAGCTLGAPVELWPVDRMERLARENGESFPPNDYWRYVYDPQQVRYGVSRVRDFTRDGLNGVPVDDDIAYTLLGLLVLETHGVNFTTAEVGEAWARYLPVACTAEEVALANLKRGIRAEKAGEVNNPYCEWIGGAIRADPWGYAAPGWPERAAELAWRDARLSHRRNGIYGEMFWAAAISAAFALDDPVEAIRAGLAEIPADCRLAREVRWALRVAPRIRDYRQARAAVEKRFPGMHPVHTINNACLSVWGISIGGTDFSRVISETVAMGFDNDCTAATAGSLVGAVVGKSGIPSRWTKPFHNTVLSYLKGKRRFSLSGLVRRFERIARTVHRQGPSEERGIV